jgi:hypothetical protein
MKTLFIVSEQKVEDHVGEEYDYILEVEDQPTTATIGETFNRIRTRIRALWMEQVKDDGEGADNEADPKVVCYLDAASPFASMLIDLQVVLKDAEGIAIELPHLEGIIRRVSQDREARELIEKLDGQKTGE